MFKPLRSLTAALFRRRRFEAVMDEEMRFHLEACERDLIDRGVSSDHARRRARLEFGGAEVAKEGCRQALGLRLFDEVRQDLGYAWRSMRKTPGFTIVAVASLAIGIGANAAVFGVVNGVLLEPFPYRDPQRLVLLFEQLPISSAKFPFSPPDYEFIRDASRSFEGVASYQNVEYEVSGSIAPQRLMGARVSPDLFHVLGVEPLVGRAFTRDDDQRRVNVTILSHGLWSSAFGRDPAVLGRTLALDGRPYTIVGVMPSRVDVPPRGASFNGEPAQLFVPTSFTPAERQGFGMFYSHTVVARLKPDVSMEQARLEAAGLVKPLADRWPDVLRDMAARQLIHIESFSEEVVGHSRRALAVLMGAVGLVLLIVCADLANLLLTRSSARRREIGVRVALGASHGRLVRQFFTEAVVLTVTGSVLGLLVANGAMRGLLSLAARTLPRAESIAFDWRVVGFIVLLSVVTPLLFGVLPALRLARGSDAGALKESAPGGTPGRRQARLLGALVVGQLALALVLTVGAGLLVRSFVRLLATDPGFRAEQTVRVVATLPAGRYAPPKVRAFYQEALDAARAIPGVVSAATSNDVPLSVRERRAFTANGTNVSIPEGARLIAPTWVVGSYFDALQVRLAGGRFLVDADGPDAQRVVIINELLARTLWPGGDAVGHQIKWGIEVSQAPWMTIVGVVGDVKQAELGTPAMFQAYVPLAQDVSGAGLLRSLNLVVRSPRNADAVITDLRAAMRRLDPALPLSKAQPLTEMIRESVQPQRFSVMVIMLFAAIAVGLAAIGIYGVLANVVAQQVREIGIRMALGATASNVLQLVFGRALRLMAAGVALGLAASLAVTRVMAGLLYEVRPTDAATFFAAALTLAAAALLASLIPAWRATRVDPLLILRSE